MESSDENNVAEGSENSSSKPTMDEKMPDNEPPLLSDDAMTSSMSSIPEELPVEKAIENSNLDQSIASNSPTLSIPSIVVDEVPDEPEMHTESEVDSSRTDEHNVENEEVMKVEETTKSQEDAEETKEVSMADSGTGGNSDAEGNSEKGEETIAEPQLMNDESPDDPQVDGGSPTTEPVQHEQSEDLLIDVSHDTEAGAVDNGTVVNTEGDESKGIEENNKVADPTENIDSPEQPVSIEEFVNSDVTTSDVPEDSHTVEDAVVENIDQTADTGGVNQNFDDNLIGTAEINEESKDAEPIVTVENAVDGDFTPSAENDNVGNEELLVETSSDTDEKIIKNEDQSSEPKVEDFSMLSESPNNDSNEDGEETTVVEPTVNFESEEFNEEPTEQSLVEAANVPEEKSDEVVEQPSEPLVTFDEPPIPDESLNIESNGTTEDNTTVEPVINLQSEGCNEEPAEELLSNSTAIGDQNNQDNTAEVEELQSQSIEDTCLESSETVGDIADANVSQEENDFMPKEEPSPETESSTLDETPAEPSTDIKIEENNEQGIISEEPPPVPSEGEDQVDDNQLHNDTEGNEEKFAHHHMEETPTADESEFEIPPMPTIANAEEEPDDENYTKSSTVEETPTLSIPAVVISKPSDDSDETYDDLEPPPEPESVATSSENDVLDKTDTEESETGEEESEATNMAMPQQENDSDDGFVESYVPPPVPESEAPKVEEDKPSEEHNGTVPNSNLLVEDSSMEQEGVDENDKDRWLKTMVKGQPFFVDLRAIANYKKFLSFGGFTEQKEAIIMLTASHLPNPSEPNYNYIINHLYCYTTSAIELLAPDDYIVVYFHCFQPSSHMPPLAFCNTCYGQLDFRLRKSAKAVYIVHANSWVKTASTYLSAFK